MKESVIVRVSADTKRDLKIIAAQKNTSMNTILEKLILDYIKENKI